MNTINRRQFLKSTAAGLAALSLAGTKCHQSSAVSKPNIIYMLADDLGYGDLSCQGQTHFETPHIDQLAADGMRFTQHYAGSTVCAPSRSCLMTGLHTGHTPVRGNRGDKPEGQHPLRGDAMTIAEVLKRAGYATGAFGKWGLGFIGTEGDPNKQGFDEFFGFNCQSLAHRYYPPYLWHNDQKVDLPGNDWTHKVTYAPDVIHQKALEFLEQHQNEPFFLYLPCTIPHAELIAPEDEILQNFRRKFVEVPFISTRKGAEYGENSSPSGYASQSEPHATFAAMVTRLDRMVGEIMAKVKSLGLDENTIILFSSDNGPHKEGGADPEFFKSHGPFKGIKRDLYEGGIRVPMMARWPGKIAPGSVTDHISAFWDVLPTAAEIANASYLPQNDGISFLPTLKGQGKQSNHQYLYWEFHGQGGKQAVRLGNWKGIRLNMANNPEAPIELYDLSADMGETNNIADQHPEIVEKIKSMMQEAHIKNPDFLFEFEK